MRWVFLCLLPLPATAETVLATRVIKVGEVITAGEITLDSATIDGMIARPDDVIGQEARLTLYPGRPIPVDAVGPPATIQRNQIVRLSFLAAGLAISAEGRALSRGGTGDLIKVMNLDSRTIIQGRIMADGTVRAGTTEG